MEFWGVELKAGESLKVNPGDDKILHLSQASLGEVKKGKGNESVPLYVNVAGQKLVIGTLSSENCAQITFDLVFEKEFELSHNWKNGSVYFLGYKSVLPDESDEFSDFGSDSEEEDIPLQVTENGKPLQKEQAKTVTVKANAAKLDSSAAKPKVKIVEPEKDDKSKDDDDNDEEDDDSDDEDDSDEDETDDEDMLLDAGDDSDEDDESSDDEEDEKTPTPKKGKKRPLDSATKTPASDKKAKLVTPQKTDGKKGAVHTATPYPNKHAAKTPANSDKPKGQQTPKSSGQIPCKSCNKTFNSDGALDSHTKAKHSAGK